MSRQTLSSSPFLKGSLIKNSNNPGLINKISMIKDQKGPPFLKKVKIARSLDALP